MHLNYIVACYCTIQQTLLTSYLGLQKMNIKSLLILILGSLIGGGIVAIALFPQIENRYAMGVNTGYIQGGNDVIEFLDKHINNDIENRNLKNLETYLDHKISRISIVEIDGIKTVSIQ